MKKTAIISEDGKYRYRLTRGEGRLMPVVMLNPSTANASEDDPTIRRLLGFAQRGLYIPSIKDTLEYDGIDVVNLYGLRATNPRQLRVTADPYGPDNEQHHHDFCKQYGTDIIVAWGGHAEEPAERKFFNVLRAYVTHEEVISCFGCTKNGKPRHPLYLSYATELQPYFGHLCL